MAPSHSGPMYAKDEKVLCFHGELLYEAKILDSKAKDPNDKRDGFSYRIHYKGWKNTWDDWVPQERIRKLTEENKELASNLKKEMDAQRRAASGKPSLASTTKKRALGSDAPGSSARGSEDRSSAAPPPPHRGTKRGREIEGIDKKERILVILQYQAALTLAAKMERERRQLRGAEGTAQLLRRGLKRAVDHEALSEQHANTTTAQEEDFLRRPAVKIFIPDALKSILVDDWEKVTKENKLAPVPSPTPVTMFLNEYETAELGKRQAGSPDADILEEVIAGVKEYFNKALGRVLLYRFERGQFYEWHKELEKGHGEHAGETFCDVYGCEHLLRLFVTMPDLIAHTNMDSQAVSRLREELSKMTQWMAKRIERYLSTDYDHVGQDYQDGSKGGA